jgi:hypothetical protein
MDTKRKSSTLFQADKITHSPFNNFDLAAVVHKYPIPDFSNCKNHDAFEAAFARLEKDLRASVSR